jgi:hypothetical protein
MEWIREPFFQVGLPVMVTFVASTWCQGKRLDDLRADVNRRLDEIIRRLDRIESNQANQGERITRIEERTGPIAKGR